MANQNVEPILNFKRSIPAPFDSVPRKQNVCSQYGKTSSTMCGPVVKMILTAIEQNAGQTRGGVGVVKGGAGGDLCVAEYKSSIDDDFHIVAYNRAKGSFMASVYDYATGSVTQYKCNGAGRDGTALLLAMFPVFAEDKEFKDTFDELFNHFISGWSDMDKAAELMCILSDNVYRRLKDTTLPCSVPVDIDKSGNINRVNTQALRQGTYEPTAVILGSFEIFATKVATNSGSVKQNNGIDHKDFIGKYPLSNRTLTPKEQALVPNIPAHIIITEEAETMCKLAHGTTGKYCAQRNFLLRGGAGSGKTCTAKQVASGLRLPLVTLTCHPDLSMDELIGVMLPKTGEACEGDAQVLSDMGGVTPENIAKLLNLPDLDTIEFEPETAYKRLTGVDKADATPQDCILSYTSLIADKLVEILSKKEEKDYLEYEFVEGPLLKAIKYGWVCEIQEPTVIARPGVLAGLNSILEQEGSITLPDGRVIKRHPDAVVICTTNISYEGCRGLNQSVIDRMSAIFDVETPALPQMVERAMAVTGETDEGLVRRMGEVVCDVAQYCKENCITDGVTGMRVLIDWVAANQVIKNPYKAALNTVIAKATNDEEEKIAIQTTCLDPMIAPTGNLNYT